MAALMGTTAFGAAKAADVNVTFDPGTVADGLQRRILGFSHLAPWSAPQYPSL